MNQSAQASPPSRRPARRRDFYLVTGANNLLVIDPTKGLRLPAVPLTRERIATADEAHRLITALDEEDQALWG